MPRIFTTDKQGYLKKLIGSIQPLFELELRGPDGIRDSFSLDQKSFSLVLPKPKTFAEIALGLTPIETIALSIELKYKREADTKPAIVYITYHGDKFKSLAEKMAKPIKESLSVSVRIIHGTHKTNQEYNWR